MIIKVENLPLHEQIYEFLRANYYLADAADLSREMGKSRSYMATLRYSNHEPSQDAYNNLKSYLHQCMAETTDSDLRKCFNLYLSQIEGALS